MVVTRKRTRPVSPKRKSVPKKVAKRKSPKRKVPKRKVSKRKTKSKSSKKRRKLSKKKSKRKVMKGGTKTVDTGFNQATFFLTLSANIKAKIATSTALPVSIPPTKYNRILLLKEVVEDTIHIFYNNLQTSDKKIRKPSGDNIELHLEGINKVLEEFMFAAVVQKFFKTANLTLDKEKDSISKVYPIFNNISRLKLLLTLLMQCTNKELNRLKKIYELVQNEARKLEQFFNKQFSNKKELLRHSIVALNKFIQNDPVKNANSSKFNATIKKFIATIEKFITELNPFEYVEPGSTTGYSPPVYAIPEEPTSGSSADIGAVIGADYREPTSGSSAVIGADYREPTPGSSADYQSAKELETEKAIASETSVYDSPVVGSDVYPRPS